MIKIFFLLTAIIANIFCLTAQKQTISLEDIYKKKIFNPDHIADFHSMKNGKFYVEVSNKGIVKKEFITGKEIEILVVSDNVTDELDNPLPLNDYLFSNDETKILIFKDREYIYRRSSKALTYIYDLPTKKILPIFKEKILHATISPDNSKVGFVYNNNLYVRNLKDNSLQQITFDGKFNHIINGNCDWVYEEEFEFTKAFSFSKDSKYIAYYKFDETNVDNYTLTYYLNKKEYPTWYTYKYPKAGGANSVLEIHIYNFETQKDIKADVGKDTDIYIPRIKWTEAPHDLVIYKMNRWQNELQLLKTDVTLGKTSLFYQENNNWYIDINDDLYFLKNNKHFIITAPKNGYTNAYLYDMNGKLIKAITNNKYDIDKVLGVDETLNVLYFTAAYPTPMDRTLLKVNLSTTKQTPITEKTGWHDISFNQDFSYFVDKYSTINLPSITCLFNLQGDTLQVLSSNEQLNTTIANYNFQQVQFIKLPAANDTDSLNACILLPPDFKKDLNKKYPVLFCNYGGPGSQTVKNVWGVFSAWHQMMAQKGYIIVSCDNRGTGFRGEYFQKCTYMQLGKLEIEDQMSAAKALTKNPYYQIDTTRIGHWGWSYGGFMSSLAITRGANIFSAAVAIAPVTNFRYYDNIYTERYMRTPKENANGYDDNSPIHFVEKIRGNFLLMHGTADDNVHYQNSAVFAEHLVQQNKSFDFFQFTDKNHGIYGKNTTYFLWQKITSWLLKNL